MSRVGDPLILYAQFYDIDALPLEPTPAPTIRAIYDGDEVVLATTQVESTNVYRATVTPTQVGVVLWRGETTDVNASQPNTAWGAEWINSANAEPTLIEIKNALQLGGVTLVSPVTQSGSVMSVIVGDDYKVSEDRAFTWDVSALALDFTDAVITWEVTGEVVTVTEDAGVLTLELDSDYTSTLTPDEYPFVIRATLDSGSVVTLVRGEMQVRDALSDEC